MIIRSRGKIFIAKSKKRLQTYRRESNAMALAVSRSQPAEKEWKIWTNVLEGTVLLHYQNTKSENIFWKNCVDPSCRIDLTSSLPLHAEAALEPRGGTATVDFPVVCHICCLN